MSNTPSRRATVKAARDQAAEALKLAVDSGAARSAVERDDHLGDLGWWDPKSGWREGKPGDVDTVLTKHRFDASAIMPPAPDWETAFSRGIQSMRSSLHGEGYTLLDAAKGPDGQRRVGIVKVERNGKVTTHHEGTVTCPKDGGAPFVESRDAGGICDRILDCVREYHERYISDDVRTAIIRVIERAGGMPCRQAPPHVVYYIPPTGAHLVRQLADAVDELGWGEIALFTGHASDERSVKAAVSSVNQGLEARLKEFGQDCKKYAAQDPEKTRVSTIEDRISEAARLRSQAALYREILGAAVVSVDERITEIETSLKETLGIVEAAHA